MKKMLIIAAVAALLPRIAAAQVEKQVEVTKAYVPKVESASKLAIEPDMTDTTQIRPEIDYTITPLTLQTTLTTRPIRPATVTYWEFNRPLPCYVKVGAGYPLNSVLDFYASTQNPSTGYAIGYINHEGYYAKIANEAGVKNNSTRMYNRAGIAAGKYFGRHVFEGEVSYDNRMYHRYGSYTTVLDPTEELLAQLGAGAMNDYGDAALKLRVGDDFQDLSRVNFEVALHGNYFLDHSEWPDTGEKTRQLNLGADARIAKGFGRNSFSLGLGYDLFSGQEWLSGYNQQMIRAALRYRYAGGVVDLEVGADYYHDRIETPAEPEALSVTGDYLLPFARLDFNLGTPGLKPFIEADGSVAPNDFRSMTALNPYAPAGPWLDKSSVDYNFRIGLGGSLWHNRFSYRAYAGISIQDNHLFWATTLDRSGSVGEYETFASTFILQQARQTVTSFNGEIEYWPISSLRFDLGIHGYFYNKETEWANGEASFKGNFGAAYSGRRISFGVEALLLGERSWTTFAGLYGGNQPLSDFVAPFAVDLRAHFDWRISHRVTFFVEGRNLANQRLYEYARYREPGIHFLAGIKANF